MRSTIGVPATGRPERQEDGPVSTDREIGELIKGSLDESSGLTPMPGFKMDLSANPGFRKFFFSARCDCGTVALLSAEIAEGKSLDEVRQALPSLTSKLEDQARAFRRMSCEMHEKMRLGPAQTRTPRR